MTDIDLTKLLNFHQSQAVEAKDHFSVYSDLLKYLSMDEYKKVQINYNTAWFMIAKASLNSAINIICKLYDQEKSAMSLRNLLIEIKSQKSTFTEEAFRNRCPEKNQYKNLAAMCVYPGDQEVDKDIDLVTNMNTKVHILTKWRSNYYAHYSKEIISNAERFAQRFTIDKELLEELLNQCCGILNKYQNIYNAETDRKSVV